jgi:CHAD domain-containing protein
VKAKRVKDLDPDAPFVVNAQKILAVRTAELQKLGTKALDPSRVRDLHDTRIAAKRLRYLYEITEPCFGKASKDGAKRMRELQDLLGEIHDCDVMSERIRRHVAEIPVEDERYIGHEALASYLEAKRRVLHREFVRGWTETDL